MKEGFIKSFDNYDVYRCIWDDVENPKGVVQLVHGLLEDAKKYEEFALFLNKNGYIVFADDHRGHGKTAGVENIGTYDGQNMVWDTIMDQIYFSRLLTEKYKLPIYVLGHGYGSFICQAYMQKCNLYSKIILSGSTLMRNKKDIKLGKFIAKTTVKHKGPNAPATLVGKNFFGRKYKDLKNGEWLSSDKEKVEELKKSPSVSKPLSAKFYFDFFSLFDWLYTPFYLKKIDKKKPIYLISGKEDFVGKYGKLIKKLFKFYLALDIEDVQMSLYEGARHDLLIEKDRKKIFKDILKFINK